jgi:hypothetical protein
VCLQAAGTHLTHLLTLLSACIAVLPILPTYVVAIPPALELALIQGSMAGPTGVAGLVSAGVLVAVHLAAGQYASKLLQGLSQLASVYIFWTIPCHACCSAHKPGRSPCCCCQQGVCVACDCR